MKRVLAVLSVLLLAAALPVLQGCNYSTASLSDVKLCADADAEGNCPSDTATFKTSDLVIYLSAGLDNAPEGTKVTATWRYLSGELGNQPQDIDTVTAEAAESGSVPFYSSLTGPEQGWPKGEYEVVITLSSENSEPIHKQFSIR